jgi:hypothetical protein
MPRLLARTLACALALQLLAGASALDMNRSVPVACKGRFELGSSAMYNLAFQWTKQSKLQQWTYTELGRGCVLVGYRTQIRLNRIFENIMPSRVLNVRIDKNVCVRGDTLEETVDLSDVLLIDKMSIKVRAEIDQATESLLMHAYSDIEVPWFLQVFEGTILSQIEHSLREYQDLLAKAVCLPT